GSSQEETAEPRDIESDLPAGGGVIPFDLAVIGIDELAATGIAAGLMGGAGTMVLEDQDMRFVCRIGGAGGKDVTMGRQGIVVGKVLLGVVQCHRSGGSSRIARWLNVVMPLEIGASIAGLYSGVDGGKHRDDAGDW